MFAGPEAGLPGQLRMKKARFCNRAFRVNQYVRSSGII